MSLRKFRWAVHVVGILSVLSLCCIVGNAAGWPGPPRLATVQSDHHTHSQAPRSEQQPSPEVAATPELLRGEPFSEFNHRLAGIFLVVGGLFFLAQNSFFMRWRFGKYVFPLCMFLPGIYLLFLSDPKWPFGPEGFWHYFTTNTQFMQHKIYAVILLVIGGVEFLRARQTLRAAWAAFVFPGLGAFGALLLLFHPHAPDHDMNSMQLVQSQHLAFAAVGGLVAISKALSEIDWRARQYCLYAWPVLISILGVLLIFYHE